MAEPANEEFRRSVLSGLSRSGKMLEPKWFYDAAGSALFDQICALPEYYPTQTELAILRDHADAIGDALGKGVALVEPGAGSLIKARLIIDALDEPAVFVPTDISDTHLHQAAAALSAEYPGLAVEPAAQDFTGELAPPRSTHGARSLVVFFPGSTIGNFEPEAARDLLRRFRTEMKADRLLIGVDLIKDRRRLVAAYDDAAGITAAFNLNLLTRINRELGADFDLSRFRHVALFNEEKSRIEMHLESTQNQSVRIDGTAIEFTEGERIHTESSHKFTPESFEALCQQAGWLPDRHFTDPESLFGVFLLNAP